MRSFLALGAIPVVLSLLVSLVVVYFLSVWTGRNLDFYLSLAQGHPVHVPFIIDVIVTVVLNGIILTADILGEIIRLFIR